MAEKDLLVPSPLIRRTYKPGYFHRRRLGQGKSIASSCFSRSGMAKLLVLLTVASSVGVLAFVYVTMGPNLFNNAPQFRASLEDQKKARLMTWENFEAIFQKSVCQSFNRSSLSSDCYSPMEPFESASFEKRPFGNAIFDLSRILLLVLFNHPHAEMIPFVEMLYRPHFRHVVYCLPEAAKGGQLPPGVSSSSESSRQKPVFDAQSSRFPIFNVLNTSFYMDIDIVYYPQAFMNRMAGENNYACFVEVARRLILAKPTDSSHRVRLTAADFDGILVSADDLLLHVWNLASPGFNVSIPWVMDRPIRGYDLKSERECAVDETENAPTYDALKAGQLNLGSPQTIGRVCNEEIDWQWFRVYGIEMAEFSDELERQALHRRLLAECHHQLRDSLGGESRRFVGNGGAGDFYYVPSSLFIQAHDVLSVMAAHNLFVEIAVPTAFRCLVRNASAPNSIIHVPTEGMNWAYSRSRSRPWSAYSAAAALLLPYYHPLKVSELLTGSTAASWTTPQRELACFVCNTILPKFEWFRHYVSHNNTPPLLKPPW